MHAARIALALLVALFSRQALAQAEPPQAASTLQEARALADRGYELFRQGDYEEAIVLFQQAEALSHSPVILSFIAQSYEALGKLMEARQSYAEIIGEDLGEGAPEDFVRAQRRAQRQAPILERRIPRLRLRISGLSSDQLVVELDGKRLEGDLLEQPISVNPGNRTLVLRAPGQPPIVRGFMASERQTSEVDVVFANVSINREVPVLVDDRRWVGPAIAYGIGFAGLTLGAVAGFIHIDRARDLRARCPGDLCPPELETERDTLRALGVTSIVGLSVAGAGLAAGTIVLLLTPDESDLAVTAGLGGLSAKGRF